MVTHFGLTANHGYDNDWGGQDNYSGTLWGTQRTFQSGNVKIHPTDYTFTYMDVNANWHTVQFEWLSVQFAVYLRKQGNKVLNPPIRQASGTIRKYWGQDPGWITLGSVPAGVYSVYTRPARMRANGHTRDLDAGAWIGMDWGLTATFDMYHH